MARFAILLCLTPLALSLGGAGTVQVEEPKEPFVPDTKPPTNKPTAQPTRPPTFKPDPDMFPVTFEEYSNGAKCGSDNFKRSTCYQDKEGNHFRYGCKSGDGLKVYTDSCGKSGCDPENCQNNWKWYSDEANICIADEPKAKIFKFTCHAPGAIEGVESIELPDVVTPPKTCGQLKWPTMGGSASVCGASTVLNGRCSGEVDLFTARRTCSKIGARLCTSDELGGDEAKGTGCKFDCRRVWSSTKCATKSGAQGFISLAGSRKCKDRIPELCEDATSQSAVIRCCADAGPDDEEVVVGPQPYPSGFTKAVSSDYKASDGECGKSTPIRQYNCWVNPVDGTSQRFACRPGSSMVWAQSCGSTTDCSKCEGEWFTQDEAVNKCYSTTEDFLYSYTCA